MALVPPSSDVFSRITTRTAGRGPQCRRQGSRTGADDHHIVAVAVCSGVHRLARLRQAGQADTLAHVTPRGGRPTPLMGIPAWAQGEQTSVTSASALSS